MMPISACANFRSRSTGLLSARAPAFSKHLSIKAGRGSSLCAMRRSPLLRNHEQGDGLRREGVVGDGRLSPVVVRTVAFQPLFLMRNLQFLRRPGPRPGDAESRSLSRIAPKCPHHATPRGLLHWGRPEDEIGAESSTSRSGVRGCEKRIAWAKYGYEYAGKEEKNRAHM